MISGISGIGQAAIDSATAKDPKVAQAAGQFESLLIAQMLKTMRESESGWLGTGEDGASDSTMALAEEHFAGAISAAGGFGLSKLVSAGLEAPNLGRNLDLSTSELPDRGSGG